jgi:hypothetical protein
MNERSRLEAAPQTNNITTVQPNSRQRRWWDHPEDLPDDELMLVVRAIAAVDRAVDGHRKKAA